MSVEVEVEKTNYLVEYCEHCGAPQGSYNSKLKNEKILIIRESGCFLIEESSEKEFDSDIIDIIKNLNIDENKKLAIIELVRNQPKFKEVKQFEYSDLLEAIEGDIGCDSGIIPRGCVFWKKLPKENNLESYIFIICKQPGVQNFLINDKQYNLSLPFLHLYGKLKYIPNSDEYYVDVNTLRFFLTTRMLQDDVNYSDLVYRLPLNNQYENGRLCFGKVKFPNKAKNKAHFIHTITSILLSSEWNNDLSSYNKIPPELKDYDFWAQKSSENSLFTIQEHITWQSFSDIKTLKDIMNE